MVLRHKLRVFALLTLIIGVSFICVFPREVEAISTTNFNPNRIIDDAIFFKGNSMNTNDIQAFLNAKVPTCDTNGTQSYSYYYNSSNGRVGDSNDTWVTTSRAIFGQRYDNWRVAQGLYPKGASAPYTCLRHYSQTFSTMPADAYCSAVAGGTRSGADIIAAVAQACGINPQVLLVLLQKEQTFITDDWPWGIQYLKTTGYACPDNPPSTWPNGCDPAYAGFFSQVYYGARQYKKYIQLPNSYNYAVGRTSFVGYNPDGACGGTYLTPNTQATAALYNYTPYQPNAATLAANEGVEVTCGAYGNLNFWRKFNEWFGPTLTDEFAVIMADNGDPTQWILENGVRYVIPDIATKIAWGLSPQWDSTYVFNGSYISTLPSGPTLGRVVRPAGGLSVYLVDGGKKFRFGSIESMNAWGYNASNVIDMPFGISNKPSTQGDITYTVSLYSDPRIFLVDGGYMRHIIDPNVLVAWAGDNPVSTPVSTEYFNSRLTGSDITGIKVTDGYPGATEYLVVAGQKLAESINIAQLYPGVAQTISTATINRLITSSPATQFIKSKNSQTIYMVDNSTKHVVTTPELLRAWGVGANPSVNIVTQGNLNLLSDGDPLKSFEADVGGQLYLMDGRKIIIPSELGVSYRKTGNVYSASQSLMNLSPNGEMATSFIKGSNTPQIYLMDNTILRNIGTPNQFTLWNNNQKITSVSEYVLNQFGVPGSVIGSYITDGTNEYVMEAGKKHLVSSRVKENWQLSNPSMVSATTTNIISGGIALNNQLQKTGNYYLVHEGKAYLTVDQNIADVWGIKNAPIMDIALVSEYLSTNTMTRFAKSKLTNDSRLFTVDNGILYHLSPNQAANMGISSNQSMMAINPEAITSSITTWSDIVVKDSANKAYVIDGGFKRPFPNSIVQNFWTNNGSISVTQRTNGFLNLLPNKVNIERAVKGSAPNIYAVENMTKRWIQSWNTYQSNYAPYTQVNDTLLNVLPAGLNIQ